MINKKKNILCFILIILTYLFLLACDNGSVKRPDKTNVPEEIIKNRIDLRFDSNGNFKIAFISDLEENIDVSLETIENINKVLDREKPNLVILGGNLHDDSVKDPNTLKAFLDIITEPMESRKIPWAHVYGSDSEIWKDGKCDFKREAQNEIYQSYAHCISKMKGSLTDYVLTINENKSEKIIYNIWLLDTNSYLNNYVDGLEEEMLLNRSLGGGSNYDTLHFSQVKWYRDTSNIIERHVGNPVAGLAYFHLPLHEFNYIYKNSEATSMEGNNIEKVTSAEMNSGILWACYEKGDMRAIFCGHDRQNDFSGKYMDMLLAYTSTVGKNANDSTRGARIVLLKEDDLEQINSWMSYIRN